jgi:SAM-dependent MidA family methyltransferase
MKLEHIDSGNELEDEILAEIKQSPHQAISFHKFMGMCLYHPEAGYYANRRTKIGKEGDFYTSSSIGSIMGEMLARYFAEEISKQFAQQGTIQVVEWGGGTGQLAKHMLDEMQEVYPGIYDRIQYISIEESAFHVEMQKNSLKEHHSSVLWMSSEEWFAQGNREETIIYSNELLDAFPVHRIVYKQKLYYELYVEWNEQSKQFMEKEIPITSGPLLQYLEEEGISLIEGQKAEINLQAGQWIERIGKWLEKGLLVTIDYGDQSEEIYAAHRMAGTLMCYRNHQAYDNPYIHVGEQDMTAHVDFSSCIRSGLKVGFNKWSLVDQKTFLIQAGIMDKLQNHDVTDPFHPMAKKNRAIRQILWSDQMSELFKVLVQKK